MKHLPSDTMKTSGDHSCGFLINAPCLFLFGKSSKWKGKFSLINPAKQIRATIYQIVEVMTVDEYIQEIKILFDFSNFMMLLFYRYC